MKRRVHGTSFTLSLSQNQASLTTTAGANMGVTSVTRSLL